VLHKLRRGALNGDESIADLGGRIRNVVMRVAREHPGEVSMCVSHADPIQAAWVLFEGRPQTERELYRKSVAKGGMLDIAIEGDRISSIRYVPPPAVAVA